MSAPWEATTARVLPFAPAAPTVGAPADRTWSAEQQEVFRWFDGSSDLSAGHSNLVVRARAGTGKTTTILEAINHAPEATVLLAAFNKRIQEELQSRLRHPGAQARTLHALGYACVRRYWERMDVEPRQLPPGTLSRAQALAQAVCGDQAPDAIKRLVAKLATLGREMAPHARTAGDLADVIVEFDLAPAEEWEAAGFGADYVEARALEALELAATKRPPFIDHADQLFLPVRNRWLVKQYDLGVVDEAQDMTLTQLELFLGVVKGRVCVVGDDRQAIYGFRGADSDSLDRLKAQLQAGEVGLTSTYRCPRLVVEAVAPLVPDFRSAPGAPAGEILRLPTLDALVRAAEPKADADGKPHDFILSRSTAPLVGVAMALLRAQKRVRVQGRNIGEGLASLVRTLSTGEAARSLPAFFDRLRRWQERQLARAERLQRPDLAEAVRDKAETLVAIADGATGPQELRVRLESLFADTGAADAIVCSTVHKAKGLEAQRVFVLRPTLMPPLPPGKERTPKQVREEQNIQYVAMTRAQATLVWVEAK